MRLFGRTLYKSALTSAALAVMGLMSLSSCKVEGRLDLSLSPKYENKEVAIATYGDSIVLATAVVKNGKASFNYEDIDFFGSNDLAQLLIDGRTRACFVVETGVTQIDSMFNVTGTPLNAKFSRLKMQMDSVEDLDDMGRYVAFVEKTYNANKDNAIGEFFGTELVRNLESSQIDSLLSLGDEATPDYMLTSKRVARYKQLAEQRQSTAPGAKYVDFKAKQPNGSYASLSKYAGMGKWTLVQFWASWCPYCIKEIPQLKALSDEFSGEGGCGLDIVAVAVRDDAADTQKAIDKYGVTWPVIFNAGRVPYDLYGFTGIPHLMLLSPDGTIVSRGETPSQIADRLRAATAK